MYVTINYNYGECKSWANHEYKELVESSKAIAGKPRVYLSNLMDRPVIELIFHQNFILVMEIGTANVLSQMTIGDIFTLDDANKILEIVDRYNPVEEEKTEGVSLKFKLEEV